ncbi:MAG TPA: hypothetical protein VF142_20945 [Longimicrobium sp.]
MRIRILVPALALAACGGGGDGAVVEGTFAPGMAADGVWVVESRRGERADSSGFRLADLTPGPVSLRLLRGEDTAAVLNVASLPDGARLRLEGLRVDGDSRYAFPRRVELDGADVVTVNGVRLAPDGRVPRDVDERGAVLGWSSDVGALLVRPANARLPDLRVVVGMATEIVGTDGGGANPVNLRPGDTIRVEGRVDEGYVVATRITMPTRIGGAESLGDADAAPSSDDDDRDADADDGDRADAGGRGSAGPAPAPIPVARAPAVRSDDRPGRGNARGRGEERGKGRGNDKKNRG